MDGGCGGAKPPTSLIGKPPGPLIPAHPAGVMGTRSGVAQDAAGTAIAGRWSDACHSKEALPRVADLPTCVVVRRADQLRRVRGCLQWDTGRRHVALRTTRCWRGHVKGVPREVSLQRLRLPPSSRGHIEQRHRQMPAKLQYFAGNVRWASA